MKMNRIIDVELDKFISKLRWVLERKDFNEFWPVGIPTAGINCAKDLIIYLDQPLTSAAEDNSFNYENPTSLLLVYLYCIYGLRELAWDKDKRIDFTKKIFTIINRSKKTGLTNSNGKYLLNKFITFNFQTIPWVTKSEENFAEYTKLIHNLGGTLWAFGEAAYYFNHRIATERHGPYRYQSLDKMILIRSAFNLNPTDLWGNKILQSVQPTSIYIYGCYNLLPVEFDLFSNPIFQFDINGQIDKISIYIKDHFGTVHINPDAKFLRNIIDGLNHSIVKLLKATNEMTPKEKIDQVFKIMLKACHPIFKENNLKILSEFKSKNVILPKNQLKLKKLNGNINYLLKYYDIREEV